MSATEIVLLGAGVILLVLFIAAAVNLKDDGVTLSQAVSGKFTTSSSKISNGDTMRYDDEIVSGADVVNAIRGNTDAIKIEVVTYKSKTEKNDAVTYTTMDGYKSDPASANYINPNAKFTGKVLRSKSDAIVGISFTQNAYVNSALAQNSTNNGTGKPGSDTGGTSNDETVATLNTISQSMTNSITALNSSLTAIAENVQYIRNYGTTTGGSTGNVTVDMSSVATQLAKVSSSLTEIENTINNNVIGGGSEPTMDDLANSIAQLQDSIDHLNGSGSDGGSGSTVDPDSGSIEDLKQGMTDLSTQVDAVNNSLNKLSDFIVGSGDADTSMSGRLDVASSNIKDLQKSLDELQKKVDSIRENLGDREP